MGDIFLRIQEPELMVDNGGSGLLVRSEIVDTTSGNPVRTGAQAHLTMSPASAMALLLALQKMRDLHGWTEIETAK